MRRKKKKITVTFIFKHLSSTRSDAMILITTNLIMYLNIFMVLYSNFILFLVEKYFFKFFCLDIFNTAINLKPAYSCVIFKYNLRR